MQFTEMIMGVVGMVAVFATIVGVFWIKAAGERARTAARIEVQNRLIDKFATSAEFVQFVGSPEGQRFLSPTGKDLPSDKGLGAMKWGVFFISVGAGFLLLSTAFGSGFAIPGGLMGSLGVGLFASGYLSNRFARSTTAPSFRENEPQQI